MAHLPVRVTIKVDITRNRRRRPRMFKWLGYERRMAELWENGLLM